MERWGRDPDTDEPSRWWTIDPATGQRAADTSPSIEDGPWLGDWVLEIVRDTADTIVTTFAVCHMTDDDLRILISGQSIPTAFRGAAEDAAELRELVNALWSEVEGCYELEFARTPDARERRWLTATAVDIIHSRHRPTL